MKKEEYIKAIEKLNSSQIDFYNSKEFKKYRRDLQLQDMLYHGNYNSFKRMISDSIQRKLKRIKKFVFRQKEIEFDTRVFIEEKKIGEKDLEEINKKKKIVYSCIIGNYDKIEDPIIETDNTDYILYTDNIIQYKNLEIWKVRKIPEYVKKKCHNNPILTNRYIKMHPKELFPKYDYSMYIDGNINIISDLNEVFIKSNTPTGLAMHLHAKRNDTYEEALYCMRIKKGNCKQIYELIKKYKKDKFPMYYGLCEACVISNNLKNTSSEKILDDWWKEFCNRKTNRDQLSFSYVLWKNNYLVEEIGILGTNIETNPKFRKKTHKNYR